MRTVRTSLLLAAAALSLLAPAAPAGPGAVNADVRTCVAVRGVGSCTFSCRPNGTVSVEVHGAGDVQGSASCRTGAAHCADDDGLCSDSDSLGSPESTGWCDLTEGLYAICRSS